MLHNYIIFTVYKFYVYHPVVLILTELQSELNFKRRSADYFIYRLSPYRVVNTFHLGYKNQSVFYVNGTSRCLFSDKYKTHKYSMERAYNC
jgi:hypothetical protein